MFSQDIKAFRPKELLSKGVFVIGNSDLLKDRCISVSGTRKINKESITWLENMISQIKNRVIVSGLALGTDAIAHKAAMKNDLPTVAILPSGLLNIQPKKNRKLAKDIVDNGGALVSTYAAVRGIDSFSQYHDRNKLIAEAGEMLIVPQFDKQSGTRSTVDSFKRIHKNGRPIIIQDTQKYSGNKYIIESDDYFTLPK